MIFRSPYGTVDIPDVPLHEVVLGEATARGDAPALIDGLTGRTITYAQLAEMVRRLAGAFAGIGLRKGDVLGIFSPNNVLYPVVFHGALAAGATVTTVNSLATAHDVRSQLADSGARYLVTISDFLDRAADAPVKEIFLVDRADGHRSIEDFFAQSGPPPEVSIDPGTDLAVLPYSSGTTGTAKGVMLTHRNVAANVVQAAGALRTGPGDRVIAVLPFFHIYGLTVLMNIAWSEGAAVVPLPRFELATFLRTLQDQGITAAYVVPPIVLALAKHPMVDDYDLSALTFVLSGAAPLDGDLASACARRLGCPVVQGYGMTEMSPVSHTTYRDATDTPPGSIGNVIPSTECRLVDVVTGVDLGPDKTGELLVRGPQVMRGYLGHPEATDATVDAEGWLHTGDLASVDEHGNWYIVDRVKELIKYKGYQVPPAELEAILLTHAGVADAAVVGVRGPDGEEYPQAFVVTASGASVGTEELMEFVAGQVAPYKKIRAVHFVDAIPKSASGKILRKELRAALASDG